MFFTGKKEKPFSRKGSGLLANGRFTKTQVPVAKFISNCSSPYMTIAANNTTHVLKIRHVLKYLLQIRGLRLGFIMGALQLQPRLSHLGNWGGMSNSFFFFSYLFIGNKLLGGNAILLCRAGCRFPNTETFTSREKRKKINKKKKKKRKARKKKKKAGVGGEKKKKRKKKFVRLSNFL